MGLQSERAPDAADRHAAEAGGFSQFTRAPVRLSTWRSLQCLNDDLLNMLVSDLARGTRSRLIIESFHSCLRNRERHLPTMPSEQRNFLATDLLSSPSEHARTTRARRASAGWLRARCESDSSRSRSSSLNTNGCFGRPVRM